MLNKIKNIIKINFFEIIIVVFFYILCSFFLLYYHSSIYLSILYIVIFLIFFSIIQSARVGYNGTLAIFKFAYFNLIILSIISNYFSYFKNNITIINLGQLLSISNYYQLNFIFFIDYISNFFILLILLITFVVFFFIKNYFKLEPEINKFSVLIILFSISMMLLTISANFFFFFFFWEMIGLTSFFLINFYCLKTLSFKASFKAFYFNKVSDSLILLGFIFLIQDGIDLIHIIPGNFYFEGFTNNGIIFIYFGAAVKSSQLGFHFWLPDSMEAPVPASALIHSATLVSAGVYILIRIHTYVILFNFFFKFVYIWASVTALYGGMVAMYQTDIKKLLAYSTISHCGFLFVTTLNGNTLFVLIYLFFHGFFKAISFIIAGRFIQFLRTQDLRLMSQVYSFLPIDVWLFIFSVSNLTALPGTLGLYYKSIFIFSLSTQYLSYFIITLNFLGCLTGIGYFTHVIKFFFSNENKLPSLVFNKNNDVITNSNIFSILVFVLILVIFIFSVILFNYSFNFDLNFSNIYIYKLFYSCIIIYLFIIFNIDIKKTRNYFFIYYISLIIITCLIYWN